MTENVKKRIPFVAILIGLLLGAGGGLYYAWFLNPVDITNITPRQLNDTDQRRYVLLVSEAYIADDDLSRARQRLEAMDVADPNALVASLADEAFFRGDDPDEVRAFTLLAEALGENPASAEVFSGTVAPTSESIGTPTATFLPADIEAEASPSPTLQPTQPILTPTRPFIQTELELVSQQVRCDEGNVGVIEIIVLDDFGRGLPGLPVRVSWNDRQDVFYTGFKPEFGLGYADFQMQPDLEYSIEIVELTDEVVGIDSFECTADSGLLSIPSYELVFASDVSIIETPEAEDS